MGKRKYVVNAVFDGQSNIWDSIIVTGSNAPSVSTTAGVGTMALCGTGTTQVVWLKVHASSTGITLGATGIAGAGGTWVRISY